MGIKSTNKPYSYHDYRSRSGLDASNARPIGPNFVEDPPGQETWTTVGTHTWTVPDGINMISAVVVGAGGGSGGTGSNKGGDGLDVLVITNEGTEEFTEEIK